MLAKFFVARAARNTLRRFARDTRGATAVIFGLTSFVLFGAIGLAVDYAQLVDTNAKLQASADAAALSAVSAGVQVAAERGTQDLESRQMIRRKAREAARLYFEKNAASQLYKVSSVRTDTKIVNGKVDVTVKFSGNQPTRIAGIFGIKKMALGGLSNAVAGVQPFVDVHLLVDTSGSMAFGASPADQQALTAATGCAFACHDGVPFNGYADTFAFATSTGITLRLNALNSGILTLMSKIDEVDPGHAFVRTAVYSFDDALTFNSPLTSDTGTVRSRLPSSPAISSMTEGATRFKEIINRVVTEVGPGGDGSTRDKAVKLFIIATDGAQDPGRYWTSDIPARDLVDAFDMSFCEAVKADGVNIGIIHTPYIPLPADWGYNATLGQPSKRGGPGSRNDDIAPALKGCAEDRYILADDKETIQTAFSKLFSSLSGAYLAR